MRDGSGWFSMLSFIYGRDTTRCGASVGYMLESVSPLAPPQRPQPALVSRETPNAELHRAAVFVQFKL